MDVKVKWFYHPEETKSGKKLSQLKVSHFFKQYLICDLTNLRFFTKLTKFVLFCREHYSSHHILMKMMFKPYPTNVKYYHGVNISRRHPQQMLKTIMILTSLLEPMIQSWGLWFWSRVFQISPLATFWNNSPQLGDSITGSICFQVQYFNELNFALSYLFWWNRYLLETV